MTEARSRRRSGGGAVFFSALALFGVLFALLTFQLSRTTETQSASRPIQVRKVLERRVVTTVVGSPGATEVSRAPATAAATAEPSEPITTATS